MIFFFAVKTTVKSMVSELFQQKCEKIFCHVKTSTLLCFIIIKTKNDENKN